jgi:hypothetical protein
LLPGVFPVTTRVAPTLLPAGLLVALALVCCGCTQTDFPAEKAQGLLALHPIHIDAEQAMLTDAQVACGKENELWDVPSAFSNNGVSNAGTTTMAHLNAKARDLQFDDDVVVTEPGYPRPYVQIRGDFTAALAEPSIHDDGDNAKRVEGKILITINHPCFTEPLPLMGVKKGKFNEDTLPVLHYTLESDGWHYDKLIH